MAAGAHEQHVALAEQAFGARLVEDDAAVDPLVTAKAMREGVGLISPVTTSVLGALGGEDEVNARGAPSAPAGRFGVRRPRRGHHQVGHLVDDQHDVGQRLGCAAPVRSLGRQLVVAGDVAHASLAEEAVAVIHLQHQPGQRFHHLVHVGDDLADEVRDAVVAAARPSWGRP